MMQLVYKSDSYDYLPGSPRPNRPLRAINWRYAIGNASANTRVGETPNVPQFRQPRAINWRFLAAVEA